MIQKWEASLPRNGKSGNTVLKYHRPLNSVCRHAMNVRDLDWNPCAAVKKPKRSAPSPNSLDARQHTQLNSTFAAMVPAQAVIAATIALYTGMHEGEICGLKWRCYDAEGA
jgi:integrase